MYKESTTHRCDIQREQINNKIQENIRKHNAQD